MQHGPHQSFKRQLADSCKPGRWLWNSCVYVVGHRPFQCIKCKRSFGSNSVLKAHLRTHAGSKNFECTICSTAFTTSGSLQRHAALHSVGHQCPLCPESFRTVQLVERHIKVQHSHSGNEGISSVNLLLVSLIQCSLSYISYNCWHWYWWHILSITKFATLSWQLLRWCF